MELSIYGPKQYAVALTSFACCDCESLKDLREQISNAPPLASKFSLSMLLLVETCRLESALDQLALIVRAADITGQESAATEGIGQRSIAKGFVALGISRMRIGWQDSFLFTTP